jgi:AMMECR1 domain-containing protein
VLLPEVAADRNWDKETFLENLCRKAGLPGDTWRQNPTLYAFTSVVFGNE